MASLVGIAKQKSYAELEKSFQEDCTLFTLCLTNKTVIGTPQQKERLYQEICKTHAIMRRMVESRGLDQRAINEACRSADEQLGKIRQLYKPEDAVEARVVQVEGRILPRARAPESAFPLEEKGSPHNIPEEPDLKRWVKDFGLFVLEDVFARGGNSASVNINIFKDAEREAILEMVKEARPEWKMSITMWQNMAFLTAEKHTWQEMDYRLNGMTLRAVVPTFVRGDVERILNTGEDKVDLEFDNIDERDLGLIIKYIQESHLDWPCTVSTRKMGKNTLTSLEIRNPAAGAIREKQLWERNIRFAEIVDKVEDDLKRWGGSSTVDIDSFTQQDQQALIALIQERIPHCQCEIVTLEETSLRVTI